VEDVSRLEPASSPGPVTTGGTGVTERTYWTVTAYTTADNPELVYQLVEDAHDDDLPGMTDTEIDTKEDSPVNRRPDGTRAGTESA